MFLRVGQNKCARLGADGRLTIRTLVTSQMFYIYDGDKLSRQMLGCEHLALQGFPIDLLNELEPFREARCKHPKEQCSEHLYRDLAGNMVSIPVMLAVVMASIFAFDWCAIEAAPATPWEEENTETASEDEVKQEQRQTPSPAGKRMTEMPEAELLENPAKPETDEPELPPLDLRGGILSRVVTRPEPGVDVG